MSKKLINDPERVVDESLAGLVSVNSGLKLLEGHRVVLRADVQDVVKQRICLIFIEMIHNGHCSPWRPLWRATWEVHQEL